MTSCLLKFRRSRSEPRGHKHNKPQMKNYTANDGISETCDYSHFLLRQRLSHGVGFSSSPVGRTETSRGQTTLLRRDGRLSSHIMRILGLFVPRIRSELVPPPPITSAHYRHAVIHSTDHNGDDFFPSHSCHEGKYLFSYFC